jgi:hypothetical protein
MSRTQVRKSLKSSKRTKKVGGGWFSSTKADATSKKKCEDELKRIKGIYDVQNDEIFNILLANDKENLKKNLKKDDINLLFNKQNITLLKIRLKIIKTSINLGENEYGDDDIIKGYQELIDNLEKQDNNVNKSGQSTHANERMKLYKEINELRTELQNLKQKNAINESVIKDLETQIKTAISTEKVTEDDFFEE